MASKIFIYHLKDQYGNRVDYMTTKKDTDASTGLQKLVDGHEARLMTLQKHGFEPIQAGKDVTYQMNEENDLGDASESQDPSYCSVHKVQMKERQGKYGKFYSHGKKLNDDTFIWCNGKGFNK